MKRIVVLCCTSLSFLGQAQTATLVHIAGNEYPAMFADTNLSAIAKQRITVDLTTIFSLAPSFKDATGGGLAGYVEASIPLPGGGTAVTSLNGRDYWDGVFKPSERCSMFDVEKREGFFLVDHNNQKSIRINKDASDRYLQAFAWMKANSNAVQKAHAFVTLMNSTNLVSQPIQVLRNLFHVTSIETLSDDDLREGLTRMQKSSYLNISALNFFLENRSEADDAEVPVFNLFTVDKINPFEDIPMAFPILYHDGRWGFGKIW